MYNGNHSQCENDLEEMVDRFGMSTVITMLESIADGKAEHVRSNWQDEGLARVWERMARVLNKSYWRVHKVDVLLP